MRGLRAEKAAPAVRQQRLGQGQHHQGNGRHPQQEQEQLLENDPRAMLLLAHQEEFHGRPLDMLVAQHVDQVDQHRNADEPQTPGKWMDQWEHLTNDGNGAVDGKSEIRISKSETNSNNGIQKSEIRISNLSP